MPLAFQFLISWLKQPKHVFLSWFWVCFLFEWHSPAKFICDYILTMTRVTLKSTEMQKVPNLTFSRPKCQEQILPNFAFFFFFISFSIVIFFYSFFFFRILDFSWRGGGYRRNKRVGGEGEGADLGGKCDGGKHFTESKSNPMRKSKYFYLSEMTINWEA